MKKILRRAIPCYIALCVLLLSGCSDLTANSIDNTNDALNTSSSVSTTTSATNTIDTTTTTAITTTTTITTTATTTITEAQITTTKKSTTVTANSDENNTLIVYKTPTGKRYHLIATCGGKNSTQTTLEDAIKLGLTPCKKCAE